MDLSQSLPKVVHRVRHYLGESLTDLQRSAILYANEGKRSPLDKLPRMYQKEVVTKAWNTCLNYLRSLTLDSHQISGRTVQKALGNKLDMSTRALSVPETDGQRREPYPNSRYMLNCMRDNRLGNGGVKHWPLVEFSYNNRGRVVGQDQHTGPWNKWLRIANRWGEILQIKGQNEGRETCSREVVRKEMAGGGRRGFNGDCAVGGKTVGGWELCNFVRDNVMLKVFLSPLEMGSWGGDG
ncbi:hypothetical protein Tco_0880649 [Tanacetum coccineum]